MVFVVPLVERGQPVLRHVEPDRIEDRRIHTHAAILGKTGDFLAGITGEACYILQHPGRRIARLLLDFLIRRRIQRGRTVHFINGQITLRTGRRRGAIALAAQKTFGAHAHRYVFLVIPLVELAFPFDAWRHFRKQNRFALHDRTPRLHIVINRFTHRRLYDNKFQYCTLYDNHTLLRIVKISGFVYENTDDTMPKNHAHKN